MRRSHRCQARWWPSSDEARALRLGDLDRAQVGAVRPAAAVAVVAALARRRRRARRVIVDAQHAHVVQVDDRHEPVERPRVGVVAVVVAPHPRDRAGQRGRARARTCRSTTARRARRPGRRRAARTRLDVARVGAHGVDDRHELLAVDRRLHALGQVGRRHDPVGLERRPPPRRRGGGRCRAARRTPPAASSRPARLPGQVVGLHRLAQLDRHDPDAVGQAGRGAAPARPRGRPRPP